MFCVARKRLIYIFQASYSPNEDNEEINSDEEKRTERLLRLSTEALLVPEPLSPDLPDIETVLFFLE
jgi:hypothetical protein